MLSCGDLATSPGLAGSSASMKQQGAYIMGLKHEQRLEDGLTGGCMDAAWLADGTAAPAGSPRTSNEQATLLRKRLREEPHTVPSFRRRWLHSHLMVVGACLGDTSHRDSMFASSATKQAVTQITVGVVLLAAKHLECVVASA
jgi:hypothetical protein